MVVNKLTPVLTDVSETECGSRNPKDWSLSKMKLTELPGVGNLRFSFSALSMGRGATEKDKSAMRQHEDKLLHI